MDPWACQRPLVLNFGGDFFYNCQIEAEAIDRRRRFFTLATHWSRFAKHPCDVAQKLEKLGHSASSVLLGIHLLHALLGPSQP